MYGRKMIADIIYGKNILSVDWYNRQFEKQHKEILKYGEWDIFVDYLKNAFKGNEDDNTDSGFMYEKDFATVIWLKSYAQYKYFYYLIMHWRENIIKTL